MRYDALTADNDKSIILALLPQRQYIGLVALPLTDNFNLEMMDLLQKILFFVSFSKQVLFGTDYRALVMFCD